MRRADLAVGLLVLAHLAAALWLGHWLSVWVDEGFTLETTAAGPLHAGRQAVTFELQAPLYFVLLSIWRLLGDSFWFARAFSALCTAGSLLLITRLPERTAPAGIRFLLLAWLAAHPFLLWAGSEARPYALVLLEVAAAMVLFDRTWMGPAPLRKARFALIAVLACGIYTHYYVGFLVPAFAAVLLLAHGFRRLRAFTIDLGLVALICLPIAFWLPGQVHEVATTEHLGPLQLAKGMFWRLEDYVVPTASAWRGWPWWAHARDLFWQALLLGGCFLLLRKRPRPHDACGRLGVMTAVIIGEFALLRLLMPAELFVPRHTTVLFLPLLLLFASVAAGSPSRLARALLAVLLTIALAASWAQFSSGAKNGNFREVARFLETHERPEEPVLVFLSDMVLPLRQHYHGRNELMPFPRPLRFGPGYPGIFAIRDEQEVARAFASYAPLGRAWLVTLAPPHGDTGVRFGHEILEDWVARKCLTRTDERVGDRVRVRFLECPPSSPAF